MHESTAGQACTLSGMLTYPAYGTTTSVLATSPPQVITTGQLPGVVRVPTIHDHETSPPASAVFALNPCARLGPLL
jgi:hypothetical protein